jgi:adenylosuccinate lyase
MIIVVNFEVNEDFSKTPLVEHLRQTLCLSNFFEALGADKSFPLSTNQLQELIKDPAEFAGSAIEQSRAIAGEIKKITKGEVTKVDLQTLI